MVLEAGTSVITIRQIPDRFWHFVACLQGFPHEIAQPKNNAFPPQP